MPLALPCNFAALLFDMDGTLIDSTACVERIWRTWAQEAGVDADTLLAHLHGVRGRDVLRRFAPHLDQEQAYQQLLQRELTDLEGTRPIAGVVERMHELSGLPIAIVTSAPRALAKVKLAHCGVTAPTVMVCAEDVARGKPAPDPYLHAAAQLGVAPAACLAFEDAPSGVRAARAASMPVIALTTSHAGTALCEADLHIADWQALRFAPGVGGGITVARAP
ncbi:HAD-IA family hydrolase [Chitiniphilus purpureus]|uniref:HAD-IA family hydrolase n=1 Tax=Chitiniphilus purpureus TaxID=2981137 RepID=A0ABY6DJB7_9NEIS|nr:HAD-IA family hydrolase [Chitiniphilus sp. CD1]UXY13778.1 HAD-IA family hydrolase [Chitiniphilus sp. CD1]